MGSQGAQKQMKICYPSTELILFLKYKFNNFVNKVFILRDFIAIVLIYHNA